MSRVITFSRTFPAYHPKAGQSTFFVEKILRGIHSMDDCVKTIIDFNVWSECIPKHHTIRSGNRWKVGDKFSPRVWSGKPYGSKQIIIAPDIEVKQVWEIKIDGYKFYINDRLFYHQHFSEWHHQIEELAKNDGLSFDDMMEWFKVPCQFRGQIICWNENVNY